MSLRGKRPALTAFAAVVIVLAQLVGCGSCVKDDPRPSTTNGKERRPLNLKAADKKLMPYTFSEGGSPADASTH